MSSLQAVFVIAAIGYVIGSITVREMQLGGAVRLGLILAPEHCSGIAQASSRQRSNIVSTTTPS